MRLLDVHNLHVSFKQKKGDVLAVRGVSLHIDKRGESIGIVGESGSGKSVASLAIMQLIKEPPGVVKADRLMFGDRNVREFSPKQKQEFRGRDISMIFQEPMTSLDPVFRVGEQIIEAITLHQNVGKRKARRIAADMLTKVEIPNAEEVLDYYPHQMSGGMRQRAMIAMSLSCNPRILIADEPTTALDVTIQAQVLQLIKDLQEEIGMALIVITHDLGVIAETTDRVFVMYGGKVLEHGTVYEIFEEPAQPYTKALLRSLPDVSRRRSEKLYVIEGSSPNPVEPPTGCPFHPRCPIAIDNCRKEFPERTDLSESHFAYCWRVGE